MSASAIISAAKSLISLPTNTTVASGTIQGKPVKVDIARVAAAVPEVGDTPELSLQSPPEAPSIQGNLQTAAFAATQAVLNIPSLDPTEAPSLFNPAGPGALPATQLPSPPLDYPVMGTLAVDSSAGLTLPSKPALAVGAPPELQALDLPAFTGTPLAPFDEPLPEYTPLGPVTLTAPEAPEYVADEKLIAAIATTLEGRVLVPPSVQQQLVIEENPDLLREQVYATRGVMAEAAKRGFSMATGEATAAVIEVDFQAQRKRQSAMRKVRRELYDQMQQAVRAALSSALAVEAKHFAIYMSYTAKMIETLRFNVRANVALFNDTVRLYNAKVELIGAQVRAYREYLGAVENRNTVLAAEIRGKMAALTVQKARTDMYGAQVDTLQAISQLDATEVQMQTLRVDEYQAYLTGLMANVEVAKQNMEAYREAIRGFSSFITESTAKLEAYAAQVAAEGSATDVYAGNVAAYASFWNAEQTRARAYNAMIDDSVRVLSTELSEFRAASSAQRSYVAGLNTQVRAQASVVSDYLNVAASAIDTVRSYNRAASDVAAANNAVLLAKADSETLQKSLDAQAQAEQAKLDAGAATVRLDAYAAMAQASNSMFSSTISVSGQAAARESGLEQGSDTWSRKNDETWQTTYEYD